METKEIDKELDTLETALTSLKRDYEIYFSGGSKLPPLSGHRRLENQMRRFSTLTSLSYAQRFRFNNINARFNTFADLWNKQMRYKEEGRTPSGGVLQTAVPEKPPKQRRSTSMDAEAATHQNLFNEYLKCREKTGEPTTGVSFEKFSAQLSKQKESIREKYQCRDVEFYVSVDQGKTKLKAKPVKS